MVMDMRTNRSQPAKSSLLLVLAMLLLLNGCMMVRSESDVLGEYELRVGTGKIDLTISPDKKFSEKIIWPTGKAEKRSGNWSWARDGVSFDQLWIPPEFAPEYILQAEASASANRQPKYTEPGHWYIRAEKHWGTVTLAVFPDADIDFKMVSRASR
jgi:hypothetical protein